MVIGGVTYKVRDYSNENENSRKLSLWAPFWGVRLHFFETVFAKSSDIDRLDARISSWRVRGRVAVFRDETLPNPIRIGHVEGNFSEIAQPTDAARLSGPISSAPPAEGIPLKGGDSFTALKSNDLRTPPTGTLTRRNRKQRSSENVESVSGS